MRAIKITSDRFPREVLQEENPVLLDFYAEWCGPCRTMSGILEAVEGDWRLYKIDIDENPKLASEYQIYSVPTLMVMKNGSPVSRKIGVCTGEEIRTMMKNALQAT